MTLARPVALLALSSLGLVACGSDAGVPDDSASTEQAAARAAPALTIAPNPITAGPFELVAPITIRGTGFAGGKSYQLALSGGYDSGALDQVASSVTADRTGAITWTISGGSVYQILAGPTSTVTATSCKNSSTSSCSVVATATLTVNPDPGTCAVTPVAAAPGATFTVSGSGAAAGAALTASWEDQNGASCWLGGCSGGTTTLHDVALTADANGAFSAAFIPTSDSGYCSRWLAVRNAGGGIVATCSFSFCP